MPSQTTILWLLIVLLLLAFGLRVCRLADKNVWFDEGWSTWMARKSLDGITERTAYDTHPPLYFWLLHFWRLSSGDGEFGLRYLSVAIGLLTVAATYRLGRAMGGFATGLLAALFLSISGFSIWWSQEVRMYALAALFATLLLWAAIRLWDRGRLVDWVFYVLCALAGLHTLYLFAFVLVAPNLLWLWVFWRAENRRASFARWASAQIVVVLLYLPWLAYALGRIPTWSAASPMTLGVFLQVYWAVLTTGIPVDVDRLRWLVAPIFAIFLAALTAIFCTARRDWRAVRNALLLLLGLLLPAGLVYLISLPRKAFFYTPQLSPRYLLLFASSFYILLAWGLVMISKIRMPSPGIVSSGSKQGWVGRIIAAILAAVVVFVAVYGLWQYFPSRVLIDDYGSLTATLHAYQQSGDAVVLHNDEDWPTFVFRYPGEWQGIPNGQRMTPETAEYYLAPLWQEYEGVWLIITPSAGINDPQGNVAAWLSDRAAEVVEMRLADKILRLYARTKGRAATAHDLLPGVLPAHSLEADLDSNLRLVGYDQAVREVRNGDVIHLFLYWQGMGDGNRGGDELELCLIAPGGQPWKCVDVSALALSEEDKVVRQQVDMVVPPDVPGGRYAFSLESDSVGSPVKFGRISIKEHGRSALPASDVIISHPLEADFADGVRLLGYDLGTTTLQPGDTLPLTLYWQASRPVERRYKVFTHILGDSHNPATGNPVWGQRDNEPVAGTRPTSTWQPGEVIADDYAIPLDPQAPAGRYTIEIGLYEPSTGERLPVVDAQGQTVADRVVLTELAVETPASE